MNILGISALYHDSAACLVSDGEIVAAAQEERYTRKKNDSRFPSLAIQSILDQNRVGPQDIDHVVFYEKPLPKFERLIESYFAFAPRGFKSFSTAMPVWLSEKLFLKRNLLRSLRDEVDSGVDWAEKVRFSEHHLSHAASAFYPSPFESAAILTLDGVGEWATTSISHGRGDTVTPMKELRFPHSLGLLYSSFTLYTGFRVNSGEYKLMGLAPYGQPRYEDLIRNNLIEIFPDGSFQLNMDYFDYATGLRMISRRFERLFGAPPTQPDQSPSQRDMDIAASIQKVTEEIVLRLAMTAREETGEKAICLAGGVALNCVANGKLQEAGIFEQVWVQPAAGDAGGALGAALAFHHLGLGNRRQPQFPDAMAGSLLGSEYHDDQIQEALEDAGLNWQKLDSQDMCRVVAGELASGQTVGWFHGRSEFGPRALGNRSILADPRRPEMQKKLNLQIKFRESFRPFAPVVLEDQVANWFELGVPSPYMLLVSTISPVRRLATEGASQLFGLDKLGFQRSEIPAVTHVDFSARVQTVGERPNTLFHSLLSSFFDVTGCPVLVNTSFNVRGEPIVESPRDAIRCFMATRIDILSIGPFLLKKIEQPSNLGSEYEAKFAPD